MTPPFDDGLLADQAALARADAALRHLAEAGARVRLEAVTSAEPLAAAAARLAESRPRAGVAAGPDSRLLRAVLEPTCPVPFVAWPGPGLPGSAGAPQLDPRDLDPDLRRVETQRIVEPVDRSAA